MDHIDKLINGDNVIVTNQEELCEVAREYFHDLFQARKAVYDPILDVVHPVIAEEDNHFLLGSFTEEEFRCTIFQMHPDKSLGPNWLNPVFFQHFWNLYGKDIYQASCSWLGNGYFPSSLNDINIALIPKVENPLSMKNLRPISLCNVPYKILEKVLANRLKRVFLNVLTRSNLLLWRGDQFLIPLLLP